MSEIVHLAGVYDPEEGQHCIVCGTELAPSTEEQGGTEPPRWRKGSLILQDGNYWLSLRSTTSGEDGFPASRRCTPQDSE